MPRFGGAPKCVICDKSAYPQESETYDQKVYHKTCFKCKECKKTLSVISIAQIDGNLFCKNCFKRVFKESGGQYNAFGGAPKWKAGQAPAQDESKMTKEEREKAKFEDSNVANIGSAADKAVRKNAAQGEAAWAGCGQQEGLDIWRIEKFKVVAWPKKEYGSFYTGDSYIILKTYKKIDEFGKPKESFDFDLHFWLGATSSQDEMGTAAYKTVELDDFLDQVPVQFREVQGHESDKFLDIFPAGIKLLEGGVESGFNKVKPAEYKPRLMHCKGKNNRVRVQQCDLAVASLNQGDSFILDGGLKIYQWNGPKAAVAEKNKARDIRQGISDDRNGKAKNIILDGLEEEPDFWKLLGREDGSVPPIEDIAPATDDSKIEAFEKVALRVSDDSGELLCEEIARGKAVNRGVFGSVDAYILDVGNIVYAFVGVEASKAERSSAIKFATDYLAANNRPMWTPIQRVIEGAAGTVAFEKACE